MTDEWKYTVGEWKGRPLYQCSYCPFNTLELEALEQHWRAKHYKEPEPVPPSHILVADVGGREIETPTKPKRRKSAPKKAKVEVKDNGKTTSDGTADHTEVSEPAHSGKRGGLRVDDSGR